MKNVVYAFLLIFLPASMSFAARFDPTILTLTAPAEITYSFKDTKLDIPFTVEGTPAAVWLVITTKDQADDIRNVRNGFLGWHYVNKIDTTVYISDRYETSTGNNTITWEGTGQDGEDVVPGEYNYYLWAYDHKTRKQLVSDFVGYGYSWGYHINESGADGLPLARPLMTGNYPTGTVYKWVIGSNPEDEALLQTTMCPTNSGENMYGLQVLDPGDYSIFYNCCRRNDTSTMLKWKFVTGGEAVLDESWLGWDELSWMEYGTYNPSYTDRNFIYVVSANIAEGDEWNRLRCVDFDGDEIFDKQMPDWYMPDDTNVNNYRNGEFRYMHSRGKNRWFLLGAYSCMHQMVNTSRLLNDQDDEDDMIVFENSNGDYFLDNAFEGRIEPAWHCIGDSIYRNAVGIDSNNFNILYFHYGIFSLGVSTPDGTGIGYLLFDDEKSGGGGQICDNGSNFDGLYMNAAGNDYSLQTYYHAFDSVHGVIKNSPVAVEEEEQTVFTLDQNSPNPFNPVTAITFMLPEADQTAVEVFNISGQKVDTLANDFMDAGRHSLVWDASAFSAGVYFYTVKSGDYSGTVKMTLVK